MYFSGDTSRSPVVGDYEIGPRIGSGSFAVVHRARHRVSGTYFAVKEIEKKHLNENLRKEILILRKVDHPNIIRLFEAIETEDRIYIVLEYCDGGDLAAYLQKHGRVSVDVARHFMRQLASGLQILRDNNLIHRDLKPQNLLLSSTGAAMTLKIADFGFARYLTPHSLADTLCGSPLYMAPEIIQNQKYDAKADLWSVGAILFQLVTGRPPYGGNSQLELFQNILASSELQFPKVAQGVLDPDCMELCKGLLRRNPVERLTFEEFFNHKFLVKSRVEEVVEHSNSVSQLNSEAHRTELKDEHPDISHLNSTGSTSNCSRSLVSPRGHGIASCPKSAHLTSLSQPYASDSLELIEEEYVLVNSNYVSMETLPSFAEKAVISSSNAKTCSVQLEKHVSVSQTVAGSRLSGVVNTSSSVSDSFLPSIATADTQDTSASHPSNRLRILLQYAHVLSDLAEEKNNSGSFLESLSVELVVLAIWKEAIQIGFSLQGSSEIVDISMGKEISDVGHSSSSDMVDNIDFSNPSTVLTWVERGFVLACERAEKLSKYLQDTDGKAEMPNALEIMYRVALDAGKSGAVDELVGNQVSAAVSYTKALLLLTFIVAEAPILPLNPPFTLTLGDKRRLLKYIRTLESHRSRSHSSLRQHPNQPLQHSSTNR